MSGISPSSSLRPLEMANRDTWRSSCGLAQRGQSGRFSVLMRREKKLNIMWQSGQ
jgi:hypothetical protein